MCKEVKKAQGRRQHFPSRCLTGKVGRVKTALARLDDSGGRKSEGEGTKMG